MSLAHAADALFASPAGSTVIPKKLVFMCGDAPDEGWGDDEATIFASKFGARSQQGAGIDFVLSFTEPVKALRAAVVWQRLSGGTLPRLALHMMDCTDPDQRALQEAIDLGSRLAMAAPAGTIALSAVAYAVFGEQITREIRDALVMTEVDEGEVTQASILLAPKASAELSTFAGLGLS